MLESFASAICCLLYILSFCKAAGNGREAAHPSTINFVAGTEKLRDLPSVHDVVERLGPVVERYPHELVVAEVRRVLNSRRTDIRSGAT